MAYVTFPEGVLWRANRDGSNPCATHQPSHVSHEVPIGLPTALRFCSRSADSQSYLVSSQGGTPRLLAPGREGGNDRRELVPRRTQDCFFFCCDQSKQIASLNLRPADSRPWQPSGHHTPRVARHLFASMVAQRPIHRRAPHWCPGGLKVFDLETQRGWCCQKRARLDWPTWSSNSQFIYFYRPGTNRECFESAFQNGVEERVVDLKGFHSHGSVGSAGSVLIRKTHRC